MEIITEDDVIFNTIADRSRTLELYKRSLHMFPYKVTIRETRVVKLPYMYEVPDPRLLVPLDCLIIYKDDDVYDGVINLLHIGEDHLSKAAIYNDFEYNVRKVEYSITLMSSISQETFDIIPELSRVIMNRLVNSTLDKISEYHPMR